MCLKEKRQFTVAILDVTPNCQKVHGGLENALIEAMRRAIPKCLDTAKFQCNKGAIYHIIIKMERAT